MRSYVDSWRAMWVGSVACVVLSSIGLAACSGGATQTSSVEILDWWKQGGDVSYSKPNASSLTWNQPLDMALNGQAAMTIMGDWGKGYANAAGRGDETSGVMPTPGTAGTFVFTTDTFGIPIGALDAGNAKRLLDLFGSREGQDIFNPIKGSISAPNDSLIDDPTYKYDAMAKQTFADFNDPNEQAPLAAALSPASRGTNRQRRGDIFR